MPAIKFSELLHGDSLDHDDRYEINGFASIHPSVRLEPFVVIESNVDIGENTVIGPFTQIRANTKIGKDCKIGGTSIFEGDTVIGDHVRIGTGCNFGWNTRVGNNVFIGNNWIAANDNEMIWGSDKEPTFEPLPYIIEDNVRIGISCTSLGGLTIGEGSVIGAGSLITKSIPKGVLAYGSPAKVRRKIN